MGVKFINGYSLLGPPRLRCSYDHPGDKYFMLREIWGRSDTEADREKQRGEAVLKVPEIRYTLPQPNAIAIQSNEREYRTGVQGAGLLERCSRTGWLHHFCRDISPPSVTPSESQLYSRHSTEPSLSVLKAQPVCHDFFPCPFFWLPLSFFFWLSGARAWRSSSSALPLCWSQNEVRGCCLMLLEPPPVVDRTGLCGHL